MTTSTTTSTSSLLNSVPGVRRPCVVIVILTERNHVQMERLQGFNDDLDAELSTETDILRWFLPTKPNTVHKRMSPKSLLRNGESKSSVKQWKRRKGTQGEGNMNMCQFRHYFIFPSVKFCSNFHEHNLQLAITTWRRSKHVCITFQCI